MRFHNGSVSGLSKVDAVALGRLFQRFEGSGEAFHDEQVVLEHRSTDVPSSSDLIQAAAQVLCRLREATLSQHGLDMPEILLTLLPLKNRFDSYRIAREATRLAGMRLMLDGMGDMRPDPVGAAAAANGIGLCSTFTKLDVCCQEESRLPHSLILGIEYTSASLTATMSPLKESRTGIGLDFKRYWDLGAGNEQKDGLYWRRVKEAIMQMPRGCRGRHITDVVLMGESATDDRFLRTLQDALWEVLPDAAARSSQQALTGHFEEPGFAAARGAAEIAKRVMEAPNSCKERVYCDWWRRSIG